MMESKQGGSPTESTVDMRFLRPKESFQMCPKIEESFVVEITSSGIASVAVVLYHFISTLEISWLSF